MAINQIISVLEFSDGVEIGPVSANLTTNSVIFNRELSYPGDYIHSIWVDATTGAQALGIKWKPAGGWYKQELWVPDGAGAVKLALIISTSSSDNWSFCGIGSVSGNPIYFLMNYGNYGLWIYKWDGENCVKVYGKETLEEHDNAYLVNSNTVVTYSDGLGETHIVFPCTYCLDYYSYGGYYWGRQVGFADYSDSDGLVFTEFSEGNETAEYCESVTFDGLETIKGVSISDPGGNVFNVFTNNGVEWSLSTYTLTTVVYVRNVEIYHISSTKYLIAVGCEQEEGGVTYNKVILGILEDDVFIEIESANFYAANVGDLNFCVVNTDNNYSIIGELYPTKEDYDAQTNLANIITYTPLQTTYELIETVGGVDITGDWIDSIHVWTSPAETFVLTASDPTNGETDVEVSIDGSPHPIEMTFDDNVNESTIEGSIILGPTSGGSVTWSLVSCVSNVVTILPNEFLQYNTEYTVSLTADLENTDVVSLTPTSFVFTTESEEPEDAPAEVGGAAQSTIQGIDYGVFKYYPLAIGVYEEGFFWEK